MVAFSLRLAAFLGTWLAGLGQVESSPGSRSAAGAPGDSPTEVAEVVVEGIAVYARADERSYVLGRLSRGEPVRVRDRDRDRLEGGWLAIDPPPTTIGWIAEADLEWDEKTGGSGEAAGDPSGPPMRAWVVAPRAIVRSGHPMARMLGPPWLDLRRGTMVQRVDHPPFSVGPGATAARWYAVVPPPEADCYVRAEGIRATSPRPAWAPEMLAAYLVEDDDRSGAEKALMATLPPDIAAELHRIDAMHSAMLASRSIAQWRLETVRSGYESLGKRAGSHPAVVEVLRQRLAHLTQQEQAARAAQTIETILARTRHRDLEVAQVRQRLAAADRSRAHAYSAIGFVQPSSRLVDGRKLFALIGPDGSTLAFLDLPPGVNVDALSSRRVGVRGATHYNQDLGTRLITVRDVEAIEARR